jgi:hypothetical protein
VDALPVLFVKLLSQGGGYALPLAWDVRSPYFDGASGYFVFLATGAMDRLEAAPAVNGGKGSVATDKALDLLVHKRSLAAF